MDITYLTDKVCISCSGEVPALDSKEANRLLNLLANNWPKASLFILYLTTPQKIFERGCHSSESWNPCNSLTL